MNIQDIYEELPVGVCILRRDRKNMDVLYVNTIMTTIMGLKADADITGKRFRDLWPHEDAAKFVKQLKSTTPPTSYVLPIEDKYLGKTRWVKFMITRDIWDGQDSYALWAMDISSTKEEEERLQEELQQADAAAEMKSNFLATMSHEIRTPMQTIFGLLELIGGETTDENIVQMIGTAKDSASGLLEILDDILDIAKMDADKMELDVYEVPVRLLVRGILEALSVKVQSGRVELIDDIADDVPFVVIGDPKRLRQIIMNLAGNAIKFTQEGSVTVRVNTDIQHIEVPEGYVGLRFEIADTGIGMSEEVCQKLFKPFNQADSSTSRKFGGTGLGLSICKKMTELMGGQIGVFSEEGKGSTFWFEIPTEEVSAETTSIELPELDGISVLSVEDHPQGAREIVNSLRSMGAGVESCPTYQEGLELVTRRPFDVGVIDQGLPDGLGLDLIRDIMKIRPHMGLVMYTVRDDVGLQHSLQSLGVPYLAKPASRAGLGEAVKNASSKAGQISIDGPTGLLIAEDTPSVQDVLRRQLDNIGIDADFVENGKDAIEALKTDKYGLLITDLHMPEMDGYELVRKIRMDEDKRDAEHFPVVALTADVQMAQRETYLRHGFDECLLKPVSLGQFERLLIRWGMLEDKSGEGTNDEAPPEPEPEPDQTEARLPPAIEKEAMAAQMGAFDDNAIEMLGMFTEMTTPLIEQIQQAYKDNDYHDLTEAAHSLKGAARSACANVLGDIAGDLQNKASLKQDCAELVTRIEEEFERVSSEIEALQKA